MEPGEIMAVALRHVANNTSYGWAIAGSLEHLATQLAKGVLLENTVDTAGNPPRL